MKFIFFDLDGTLTDPQEGITNSVKYALDKFGISVSDKTVLFPFIGPPLIDSFKQFYGFSEEDAELAVKYYREYFSVKGKFENEVYLGITDALKNLTQSGYKLVLATSKPEIFAQEILEFFNLKKYFYCVCGASMDASRSKKEEVIAYALQKTQAKKEDCIMVGDRRFDVIGAHFNGIKALGVTYGYGDKKELLEAGADYLVESVCMLEEFLIKRIQEN